MSLKFVIGMDLDYKYHITFIYTSKLVGVSVCVHQVYYACSVMFMGFNTFEKLIILDMKDFYIILGMSWFSPYRVVLNYYTKTITIAMPEKDNIGLEGTFKVNPIRVASVIYAQKLVNNVCRSFLAQLWKDKFLVPPIV